MNTIKVTKMQGCGNDFAVVDYSEYKKTGLELSEFAKKICDRHFGIGADGLIIPKTFEVEPAEIGWFFYNSDGTTAQMCGNGMRCFAKYVTDKKLICKKKFSVKTGTGIIKPEIQDDGNVRVNMSSPVLEPEKIPFKGQGKCKIKILDKEFEINPVSMGNPHCVIFTNDDVFEMANTYGKYIESHKLFPEKTNVEFVKIKSKNEIDFCVYERGCGITLACGTGACASVAAGVLNGLTDTFVKVNLLGGTVFVDWGNHKQNKDENIFLIGPANYVYEADYIV